MNQSPENNAMTPVPSEQRKFLERWLLEWELACRGGEREMDLETHGALGVEWPGVVMPFNADVQVGDVRLLSPNLLPEANRPVYVAVLSDWDDGRWLVAPFSAFTVPATRGELTMLVTDHPLKTLCLWNARDISHRVLSQSWIVERMSDMEREAAWSVFRHVAIGSELTKSMWARVGAPVFHQDDPRREYQRDESRMLATLIDWWEREESDTEEPSAGVAEVFGFSVYRPCFEPWEEPLAAADSGEEMTHCISLLEGGDVGRGTKPIPHQKHHAKNLAFDPIQPGQNKGLCCEWWVREPVHAREALVYCWGVEEHIGIAKADIREDGILLTLTEANLPEGESMVESPARLVLVLRP